MFLSNMFSCLLCICSKNNQLTFNPQNYVICMDYLPYIRVTYMGSYVFVYRKNNAHIYTIIYCSVSHIYILWWKSCNIHPIFYSIFLQIYIYILQKYIVLANQILLCFIIELHLHAFFKFFFNSTKLWVYLNPDPICCVIYGRKGSRIHPYSVIYKNVSDVVSTSQFILVFLFCLEG